MGKNGKVVGPQDKFDQREVSFTRLGMGRLGEGPRDRWLGESTDPFWRILYAYTRKENSLVNHLRKAVDGPVKPEQAPVQNPQEMSKIIKDTASFFGADLVGITELDQAYVYSHRGRHTDAEDGCFGEEINNTHKFAIVIGCEMDYERIKESPSYFTDAETGRIYAEVAKTSIMLAEYIRELGYPAKAHHFRQEEVIHSALAVQAGLGELGRCGYVINPVLGPRFRTAVVTTDLPLATDSPIDAGISEFCDICMKCADNCPVKCIPKGPKKVVRGVEKWAVDGDQCIKFWASKPGKYLCCASCMRGCPFNKRNTWYHRAATKIASRSAAGRWFLLQIDNIFY
jgi:epoxyqueuosine reductase